MITLARSVSKSLSVLASLPAPPFRTLTDTMSTRFLVPALISGMILTVRTVSPTLVCSSFMCFPRVLVIPFGPSTRHEQSLILFYKRILTFCSAQDMQCVENCDDPDPRRHVLYEQPVWQTLQMFRMSPLFPCPRHISEPGFYLLVGEMLCAFSFSFPFAPVSDQVGLCQVFFRCFTGTYRSAGVLRPFSYPKRTLIALWQSFPSPKSFHRRN